MISIVILLIYQEQLINLPSFSIINKCSQGYECHFMYLVLTNITLKLRGITNCLP